MTESSVTVRSVAPAEWRVWRELRLAALLTSPEAFRADYAYWSGSADRESNWRARLRERPFNAVVVVDGAPAGMVSATSADSAGVVELHALWAAPTVRGRGVGDAAVDAVVDWANEQGASAVVLWVKATNAAATALYRRHGFVDEGAPADHPDERTMRLILRG